MDIQIQHILDNVLHIQYDRHLGHCVMQGNMVIKSMPSRHEAVKYMSVLLDINRNSSAF